MDQDNKGNSVHIAALSELSLDQLTEDQIVAIEAAQEALAFGQALWSLFEDQALHNDGPDPDYSKMENLIDALNGELAAAVLFLARTDIDTARALELTADSLQKIKAVSTTEEGSVPDVVIEGNRRLAARIRNTLAVLNAKRITQVIPEAKTP